MLQCFSWFVEDLDVVPLKYWSNGPASSRKCTQVELA